MIFVKKINHIIKNENCKEFEVNNWEISKFIINRLLKIVGIHPYPLNELMIMISSVIRLKPTHIFEWGTNIGKSARIFYETLKYFKLDFDIHSVDLPDNIVHQEHPGNKRGILVKNKKRVFLHQGDGLTVSFEIFVNLNECKPLFFLDGDHSYITVKKELESIIRKIPFANILVHDTFYQSELSKYNIGPYNAVNEIISTTDYKMISTNTGLPGLTLLYKL